MYSLSQEVIAKVVENASNALYQYCKANNIHYTVVGSSGGLDSAVTLMLAKHACELAKKENYELTSVGLILPCHSSKKSATLGRKAIRAAGAKKIEVDLSDAFNDLTSELELYNKLSYQINTITKGKAVLDERSEKIARGNIMARLRMITVYDTARRLGGLVLSTDNLSELNMGFWTLHGDVGDYGMIQQIFKGLELYDIACYLGVPTEIIAAKPDDGLGITDGGDEAQLGASYATIDRIMIAYRYWDNLALIAEKMPDVNPKVIEQIIARYHGTKFKRENPLNLTRAELGLPAIDDIIEY